MLERAGHVPDVGRGAEQVAVGLECVGGGRGQGLPTTMLMLFSSSVRAPLTTASNISCSAGDGVWWTISSLGMIAELNAGLLG